jgi:hypothetical protein
VDSEQACVCDILEQIVLRYRHQGGPTMRCPYCGTLNPDRAAFCARCGRDLKPQSPNQPASYQQPRQALPPQSPYQQPQQAPATQRHRTPVASPQSAPVLKQPELPVVPPEPPALFPPRTVAQLQALEQGALAYNVVDSTTDIGRKKIVRIVYPKGVPWQQVATLLKALKEQQEDRFDTIIIQGVLQGDTQVYSFTNGQLLFDRNVLLGGNKMNRFQIETGNGFEIDSVRIVVTE